MNNIDKLVNDTLNSLEGVQRAEANPYLYTRIEQRMKNRYQHSSYQRKLMPVLAIALVLFISLNLLSYLKVNATDTNQTSVSSGSSIESFATEYSLSDDSGI
jgi:hypothetical protein